MSAPLLGLLVWQAYDHTQNDVTEIEQSALERARLVVVDTRRVLDGSHDVLATLAARPLVRAVDPTRCDPSLVAQASTEADFASIVVFDPAGRAVCWQGPSPSGMPASVAERSWFRGAIRSDGLLIGEPEVDQNGRWVVVLALPLHDSPGRLSGVIAVPVDLAHFGPIVDETALLPGETLTLANGTGKVLARQPDPAQWMGTDIRNTDIGHIMLAGGQHIAQVRGIDGIERVFGFTTVPGTDWHVYAGIPLTRVLAVWQSGIVLMIVLFTLGLALAVGLALLSGRLIARPVRVLAAAADAVAAGDLTARVEAGGFAEAAVLAERFNEMVERRRSAEEGLRQSERNLAEAQRISHIGSWESDFATGLAQRSEELHRIFGVEPGAIPGTTEAFLAFVHPDDQARVQASERAAISGSGQHDLDYRIVQPDGMVRIVHEEGELIRDPSGTPVRLVGTVQDITERVAAEEERTRLVSAVEQAADPIWVTDPDGTIRYVNGALERLFAYRADELLGRNARIFRSDRYDGAFFADLWATIGSGRKWAGSFWNRRKDGTLVEVEPVISAIRDAEGLITGYVQADRDVTHERDLEGALARRARERQMIEAALERTDSGSTPEEIAAVACARPSDSRTSTRSS